MATLQTLPDVTTVLPQGAGTGVNTLAVRSFFYAVFKHTRLVVGTFLLIFFAAAMAAILRPTTWMASTTVLVKIGDTAQLSPAQSPSKSYYLPMTPDVVKTEADIVKSYDVIRQAVEQVGVQPDPGTSMNEMISKMQLALTVTPSPGANTLQIGYIGRDPRRAARMVNAITDVYLDHHNRVYSTQGMHTLYSAQVRILQGEMKTAQRRYRGYLKREHVIDVEQEIPLLNKDLILQERELKEHRLKMRGVQEKIKQLRTQIAQSPAQIPYSQDYHANATRQVFDNDLAALEVQRYQALQAYLPTDRHVQQLDEQIAKVKARIKEEKERLLVDEELRYSDLHMVLQRNGYTLEVLLADLRAREPGLYARWKATHQRLVELRNRRSRIANLKADADEKAYAYDLYRKRNDQARIQEAMTDQSMVNVAVVQHATPPIDPQNGLLLPLLLGLVGGIALAGGLAVAVEYLNRRLRFEEEVERYLELPVLAVIPDLETTAAVAHT
jgi:succinoglycan biosynthesis transport protein ExoP